MSDLREPPLDDELAEMIAKRASEIVRLSKLQSKHEQREAVKRPHPVYPVGPEAA